MINKIEHWVFENSHIPEPRKFNNIGNMKIRDEVTLSVESFGSEKEHSYKLALVGHFGKHQVESRSYAKLGEADDGRIWAVFDKKAAPIDTWIAMLFENFAEKVKGLVERHKYVVAQCEEYLG